MVFVVALSIACQHSRPFCLVKDKCDTRIISIPLKICGELSEFR